MEKKCCNKIVVFGTGKFGMQAYQTYKSRVVGFIDNDINKQGNYIDGLKVFSLSQYIAAELDAKILVAVKMHTEVERQLRSNNINDYDVYLRDSRAYYCSDQIIYNPYENEERDLDEQTWEQKIVSGIKVTEVNAMVDGVIKEYKYMPPLEHVEIETLNRCNGGCEFCPVSVKNETREYCEMKDDLFEKIILDLKQINYKGKLALFSNNEPLLDHKIIDRHAFARKHLPYARMHLFTNGTLLTLDKFLNLMKYLDELIIDNYNQNLELIKPCKEIAAYCEDKPELREKVTIVLRKPQEILSSRGGDAPNRDASRIRLDCKCVLPFKQMIIRPDGKVSLCCNDPLGKNTLADLTQETVAEAWVNSNFQMVRSCIASGREKWAHCEHCDTMSLG